MNVKELIEKLKKCNPEATVIINSEEHESTSYYDIEWYFADEKHVEIVTSGYNRDYHWRDL